MSKLTEAQRAELADPELADAMESGPTLAEATSGQIVGMAGSRQFQRLSHHHPPDKRNRKAGSAKAGSSVVKKVGQEVDTPKTSALQELAAEINLQHLSYEVKREQARDAVTTAIEHARRAGEHLIKAKLLLPHGQYMAWLAANCPEISDRSARLYVQIARENVRSQIGSIHWRCCRFEHPRCAQADIEAEARSEAGSCSPTSCSGYAESFLVGA